MIQSHHISCIIRNSVWILQYHHTLSIFTKAFYGPKCITTQPVSSQNLCMDHPVSTQQATPVTHHCVCCMYVPSLPTLKLLNLRTLKCHCPVAITVSMMTVMTYGKWNCRHVLHCRSCFYFKCYNGFVSFFWVHNMCINCLM